MAKLTLNNVSGTSDFTSLVQLIQENNDKLESAVNNTLSRDGSTPNTMSANLDMNAHKILNLATPTGPTDLVRMQDANLFLVGPPGPAGPAGDAAIVGSVTDGYAVIFDTSHGNGLRSAGGPLAAVALSGLKADVGLGSVENKSSANIRAEITSVNITDALTYTPTSINGLTGPQSTSAIKTGLSFSAADVGLGSVENKSSATIRGEITSSNVTTALTYTPTSITGSTGVQSASAIKTALSLANVDNTSDVNKPVSTATQTALDLKENKYVPFNNQVSPYTLVLTDAGKLIELNVSTQTNITIPLNSSVPFPIGTRIDFIQQGVGQIQIVANGGVTRNSASNRNKTSSQYAACTLIKRATDEWYLVGDITI